MQTRQNVYKQIATWICMKCFFIHSLQMLSAPMFVFSTVIYFHFKVRFIYLIKCAIFCDEWMNVAAFFPTIIGSSIENIDFLLSFQAAIAWVIFSLQNFRFNGPLCCVMYVLKQVQRFHFNQPPAGIYVLWYCTILIPFENAPFCWWLNHAKMQKTLENVSKWDTFAQNKRAAYQ